MTDTLIKRFALILCCTSLCMGPAMGCRKQLVIQFKAFCYPEIIHAVPAGLSFLVVKVEIPTGVNIYANPKGPGLGKATTVKVTDGSWIKFGPPRYLPGHRFIYPGETQPVFFYSTETYIFVPFTISKQAPLGGYPVDLEFEAMLCRVSTCELRTEILHAKIFVTDHTPTDYNDEVRDLYRRAAPPPPPPASLSN